MSRADKFFSDAPSPDDAPPRKNANKMSTEVDAREAWASAGDALLWSMAAVICNQSSSIAERAEALNCAARHLRTTPEGYVFFPVEPTPAILACIELEWLANGSSRKNYASLIAAAQEGK